MPRENFARYAVAIAVAILWLPADRCTAQEPPRDHSCTADAAGIFAIPEGSDGQNFDKEGWGFQAGGGFAITPAPTLGRGWRWYITGNFVYDRFNANAKALAQAKSANSSVANATAAHGAFSAVTVDLNPRFVFNETHDLYAIGGIGWLRRAIGFNGANPSTLLQSSGPSLDRLASNSGVVDFGVGVSSGPRAFHGLMLFGEARLYRGLAINGGSTLVPISVGVRW